MGLHAALTQEANDVLAQCVNVGGTRDGPHVDFAGYVQLHATYRLLLNRLGKHAQIFGADLPPSDMASFNNCKFLEANLRAILNAIDKGRLTNIEEQIAVDVLADLVEHAEVLIKGGFMLAAAVVLRAVLEERLRKLCEVNSISISVAKPTIETFKNALYDANVLDKVKMKKVDWMASVGNAAAHNKSEFDPKDVSILYHDTIAFLDQFQP